MFYLAAFALWPGSEALNRFNLSQIAFGFGKMLQNETAEQTLARILQTLDAQDGQLRDVVADVDRRLSATQQAVEAAHTRLMSEALDRERKQDAAMMRLEGGLTAMSAAMATLTANVSSMAAALTAIPSSTSTTSTALAAAAGVGGGAGSGGGTPGGAAAASGSSFVEDKIIGNIMKGIKIEIWGEPPMTKRAG